MDDSPSVHSTDVAEKSEKSNVAEDKSENANIEENKLSVEDKKSEKSNVDEKKSSKSKLSSKKSIKSKASTKKSDKPNVMEKAEVSPVVERSPTVEKYDVPDTVETLITADHLSVTDAVPSPSAFNEEISSIYELLERLDSEELTDLRKQFYEKVVDEKIKEPKGSAHPRFCGSKLTREEFIAAIEHVLGTNSYNICANNLFDHIVAKNAEEHKGFLWWEQILDELIDWLSEKTKERPSDIIKESFCRLYTMGHCKRETIVRVVPIETPTSFCYAVVSKYGKVGLYEWNMSLLEQFEVKIGSQKGSTSGGQAQRTTWVTDAVYMSDAAMLLISASDRTMHIYSTTGLVCVQVYLISGLPNTPTCLHYTVGKTSDDPSMLLIGDDNGSISTLYFHQPHYNLFRRTSNDVIDTYFWKELETQKAWVTIIMDQEVHKDEVLRVEYFSDNNTVVSCSNDPNTTVIIRYIVGRRAPYVFRITRGVRCFHLDRVLKLLVTGGKDCVIRMWNPIIPKKSLASLFGHKTCIVDVRILRYHSVILSISKDVVLKVWDIASQTCMESLPLLFPVYGALARTPEFGVQTFYPGPVSCKPPPKTEEDQPEIPDTLKTESSMSVFSEVSNTKSQHENEISKRQESVITSRPVSRTSSKQETGISPNKENEISMKQESETSVRQESETSANLKTQSSRIKDASLSSKPTTADTIASSTDVTESALTEQAFQSDSSDKSSESCMDRGNQWTRMEVLAVCCNYLVILQLSERELSDSDPVRVGDPLPPPLRNQEPVVPSPWLTVDPAILSTFTDENPELHEGSPDSSPVPDYILGILQKSLGEEMTQEFTALTRTCRKSAEKEETQHTDLKKVHLMVEQCAPHMALNISTLEDIPFTKGHTHGHHKKHSKGERSQGVKDSIPKAPRDSSDVVDASQSSTMDTSTTTTSTKSNYNN